MRQKADILHTQISHIQRIAEIERECISGGWSENALRESFENPNAVFFTAVCGTDIAGFINGSYVVDEAELLNIAVSKNFRRTGIAEMLMKSFEKELLSFGVGTVFLEVREGNVPARSLYEKCGYTQNGLRKNYYRNPNENAVLMKKTLFLTK